MAGSGHGIGRVRRAAPSAFGCRRPSTGSSPWKRWGPYLAERAWGTVREDYSPHGTAWDFFPHDHARSRAYRWNEDGLAGICDDRQTLCFALAFWNGNDPILKERIFGLTGNEGNHGEDAKEYWWYLDSTPTHSYMRWRYHYPQQRVPVRRPRRTRTRDARSSTRSTSCSTPASSTTTATGAIEVDYAKATPDDVCVKVTVAQRRARAGDASTCCRRCGSATPGRGGSIRASRRLIGRGRLRHRRAPRARPLRARARGRPRAAVLRQRDQRAAALSGCPVHRFRRTASTITSSTAAPPSTRTGWAPRGGALPPHGRAR